MNKNSIIFFSIAAALLLVTIFLPAGCKDTQKKAIAKPSKTRIIGIYTKKDGNKQLDILLRQIVIYPKYDSIKQDYVITVDTAWGIPVLDTLLDPITKAVKFDSLTRKPILVFNGSYILYKKDSIMWQIEGKDYDTMMRK